MIETESLPNPIIGKPIEELLCDENNVPVFIPSCCSFIKLLIKTQGIFRIPGDQKMLDELGRILNFPFNSVPPCASVHDVASFLKLWLTSLPVPLIVPTVFNQYFTRDTDPHCVFDVLTHLPDRNRKTLAYLFSTIKMISDNSKFNQMTIGNLALCIGIALTQTAKGLSRSLPFSFFFTTCCRLFNEDHTDFVSDFSLIQSPG